MGNTQAQYLLWREKATKDRMLQEELMAMENQPERIEDAFYQELAFGTGGLRGTLGAGTNRMNVYTVGKASQGLASYVCRNFAPEARRIAISRDSRINSELFAETAASVFAANGIEVYIYPDIMPTPCLSYAVRALHCAAGVMVTASHNPAQYNGYKVYGPDGCQITTEAANAIEAEINAVDPFVNVQDMDYEEARIKGFVRDVPDEVFDAFLEEVKGQSLLYGDDVDQNATIIYTPLNGTGRMPVTRILAESGYPNVYVVPEQEMPDGHFPTCPYPNPEIREAMELGITVAKQKQADLLVATDPDCDRVGIAVRSEDGEYVLLTGNETGILLFDYICHRRLAAGTMPEEPVAVKTIVTTDMAERIAENYGVKMVNVLTGFKYIGETIGRLEEQGNESSYIFGFEESYGYLTGTYVRDKDAVDGVFMICEMFAWYRERGISLLAQLERLYKRYGYCLNTLHSTEFAGSAGFAHMQQVIGALRTQMEQIGDRKVLRCYDYLPGLNGLPKSDVLKFILEGGGSVVVRPSGTEPKLKVYISISASDREQARIAEQKLYEGMTEIMSKVE